MARARLRRGVIVLLAALGALWLLFTAIPLVRWWALWLSAGWDERSRPVMVVLAGDELADGTIGYSTYLRCVYAAWAWRGGGIETVVLAGGPPHRPAARAMADLLAGLGVPRDRMLLETSSTNTRENLANVARLLGRDKRAVTLLTSDYHMRRALLWARRVRLDAAPRPVPDVLKREREWRQRFPLAWLLAEETGKLAVEALPVTDR